MIPRYCTALKSTTHRRMVADLAEALPLNSLYIWPPGCVTRTRIELALPVAHRAHHAGVSSKVVTVFLTRRAVAAGAVVADELAGRPR